MTDAPWYAVADPTMAICVGIAGFAAFAAGLVLWLCHCLAYTADEIADTLESFDPMTHEPTLDAMMNRVVAQHGARSPQRIR